MSKNRIRKIVKKDPILSNVLKCFFDSSNRPKKTPLHLSVIQRKLEEKHYPWNVNEALKKLKKLGILSSTVSNTTSISRVVFYYPSIFDNDADKKTFIFKRITKSCHLIKKYSNQKITFVIGKHLHALVKAELRAQGFKIVKEGKVRSYNGKQWVRSKHTLDMIAEHPTKHVTVGVEIKNTLDVINKKEVRTKISMCKEFGIIPLFACRWLKPYAEEIKNNNGFPWQFGVQLYPLGMGDLVEIIRKRFGFRVETASEIPQKSVTEFEEYLKSIS